MGYVPRFIPGSDVSLVYPTGLYLGLDPVLISLVYSTGHVPGSILGTCVYLVYPGGLYPGLGPGGGLVKTSPGNTGDNIL